VRPIAERFWEKVAKSDGCWLWTAFRTEKGYGKLAGSRSPVRAHRVSYELAFGHIPEGLCVLHRCDNPPCVRPDHLFLGTEADNSADMKAKRRGRGPAMQGTAHPRAKLTDEQVVAIRAAYQPRIVSAAVLAAKFGVSRATIDGIVSGRYWKHLLG
jgi:hypothetical protein